MRPLGTLDYLHIAHAYHTIILKDVPKLIEGATRRNSTLYQSHRYAL